MSLQKIISIFLYVLVGISVVFTGLFYFGGIKPETVGGAMEEPIFTQLFIVWAYILAIIAAASVIIFPLVNLVMNPKNAKGALVGIVALVVVIIISYLCASDVIPVWEGSEEFEITSSMSKYVGTGLFCMYLLMGITVVSLLFTEFSKIFK